VNTKKVVAYILVLILFFLSAVPVFAAPAPDPSIKASGLISEKETLRIAFLDSNNYAVVNGKNVRLEASPYMSGKQLMIPVKFLADCLGAKYEYNAKTRYMTVTKGDTSIVMQANSKTAAVNGKKTQLAAAAASKKSVSFCPAEFIIRTLGAGYEWSEKTKTAAARVVSSVITFPDRNLEAAVRRVLGKGSGELLLDEVGKIISISAPASGIKDLNGIQYLKALEYLDLSNNGIRDISPLEELTNLTGLNLENNILSDITPLKALKKLKSVYLLGETSMAGLSFVYSQAKEIVDKVTLPEMTELEKELALYDYIITHSRYDQQNYENGTIPAESHTAYGIFKHGVGVCDGYARALQVLLNVAGIECLEVVGGVIGTEDEGHAWNIANIDGVYYHFDATLDDPVFKDGASTLRHSYFNLSDRQMSASHTWDRSKYPACNTDSEFFYMEMDDYKSAIFNGDTSFSVVDDYLYRIETDGSYEKICDDRVSYINLSGNLIYYINLDDNNKIYRIGPDGSGRMKFSDYESYWLTAKDNWLYFICNHKIHRMDINSRFVYSLSSEDAVSFYGISGGGLYYKAYIRNKGAGFYRMDVDGANRTALGTAKPAGFELSADGRTLSYRYSKMEFIDAGWLYFVNESDSNRLYKIKLDGSAATKICDDRADEYYMEIFNGWIYYRNSDDGKKYYRVKTDGTGRQPLE
jgi:hypothetical protein